MGSAPFPNRPFQLRDNTYVVRQEVPNNRSLVGFEVWIDKLSYSPTYSNGGVAYARWGYDGVVRADVNPGAYDFRGTGPWQWLGGQVWVDHNPDGSRTIQVNVGAEFTTLGTTVYSYNLALPFIARNPPPAPTGLSLDQITTSSMRYRFQGNGDGGSAIIRWEFQYSRYADFRDNPALVTSGGTSTVSGLAAGTEYFFRSRGVNTIGAGAWSNVLSATTLSSAFISSGTQWLDADVLISDGSQWLPTDILISNGSSWLPAG